MLRATSDGLVIDCVDCRRALDAPDSPLYQSHCIGCAVRSLAQGPQFHTAGLDGGDSKAYRKALSLIFGDQWRLGHARVVAEHQRIKEARARQ